MEEILNMTKALSDKNRLRVVIALEREGELCVCQITEFLELATATVSRHMSVLQNARLVKSRKDSRWVYYRLSESFPPQLIQWLKGTLSQSGDTVRDKEKLMRILQDERETLCRKQKRKSNCNNIEKEKKCLYSHIKK